MTVTTHKPGTMSTHSSNIIGNMENKSTQSRRKMVRVSSIDKTMVCSTKYKLSTDDPLPELPDTGVRVKVCFAGACSPDVKKCRTSIRNNGIMDTSLFPGYEVSGIVDEVGPLADCKLVTGDRVIIYPEEDIGFDEGYTEYVIVNQPQNIIPIPNNLDLQVAALLPCGGLTAYTACMRAKPYIEDCEARKGRCNILVVGAGGLGLWATIMAAHLSGSPDTCSNNVKVIVADTNSDKLLIAQEHGCYGVIHWQTGAYEEQIIERTKNACPDGVDVVIDFVSSPRTISRALKFMNKRGVLVVGGNSQHEVQLSLSELAKNEQIMIGCRRGTKEELVTLTDLISTGSISTPHFDLFQLEEADDVFQGLSDCKIKGRAVLQVSPTFL